MFRLPRRSEVSPKQLRYSHEFSSPLNPLLDCTWLTVRNGEQALRFYQQAFGATVVYRLEDPDAGRGATLYRGRGVLAE